MRRGVTTAIVTTIVCAVGVSSILTFGAWLLARADLGRSVAKDDVDAPIFYVDSSQVQERHGIESVRQTTDSRILVKYIDTGYASLDDDSATITLVDESPELVTNVYYQHGVIKDSVTRLWVTVDGTRPVRDSNTHMTTYELRLTQDMIDEIGATE